MTIGTNGRQAYDTPFSLSLKTRAANERMINAADEMGNATTDAAYIVAKTEYLAACFDALRSVQAGIDCAGAR